MTCSSVQLCFKICCVSNSESQTSTNAVSPGPTVGRLIYGTTRDCRTCSWATYTSKSLTSNWRNYRSDSWISNEI